MEFLQIIWFFLIIFLLMGYSILDGFDLGAALHFINLKSEDEKALTFKAIGPIWDGNEVWILTAFGALFAAFPKAYATISTSFYLAIYLLIMALIFRALSIEIRHRLPCKKLIDNFFFASSFIICFILGVAMGNIVQGLSISSNGEYQGTFLDLLNPMALLLGITSVTMFFHHGALFMGQKTTGKMQNKYKLLAKRSWCIYFPLFILASAINIIYFQNLNTLLALAFVKLSVISLLVDLFAATRLRFSFALIFSSLAIIFNLLQFAFTIFPNVIIDKNNYLHNLSVYNASSSYNTLLIMLILTLIGMPLVIGYSTYIYRVFKGKVN